MNAARGSAASGSAMNNGAGAAAILSAGVGCFALALLALAGDKSAWVKSLLNFYRPTGSLSGVTTVAILLWLCLWGFLEWRWRKRTVAIGPICAAALVMLGLGLAFTFPPIVDLF
jgi:hypothetical protein